MTQTNIPKIEYLIKAPLALARQNGGSLVDKIGNTLYGWIKTPLKGTQEYTKSRKQASLYSACEKEAKNVSKILGFKVPSEAVACYLFNEGFEEGTDQILNQYSDVWKKMKDYFDQGESESTQEESKPEQESKKKNPKNKKSKSKKVLIPEVL